MDALLNLSTIPLLSFFTGGGLLDIGFVDAGFPIIWHNEYDPAFVAGFEYAMASLYGGERDTGMMRIQNDSPLQNVGGSTIEAEAFSGGGKPSIFGIIGGPPCPDFSSAGLHKGKDGANGFLSGIYVERILALRPTFFVLENVPGLLRTAKHKTYLAGLLRKLEVAYVVDANILNALDFGVPQDRNRVFVLGFRRDWMEQERVRNSSIQGDRWEDTLDALKRKMSRNLLAGQSGTYEHWFPWPHDSRYFGAKWKYVWPQTSPLGSQPLKPGDIPDQLMVGTHIGDTDYLAALSNGQDSFRPHSPKFDTVAEGDVKGKSFKRLHRWRYSPTAAYGNREVHLHPSERRRLTVREAMRIQSVPDAYALPVTMTLGKKFKAISNGVPVTLARVLAEQIASYLNGD